MLGGKADGDEGAVVDWLVLPDSNADAKVEHKAGESAGEHDAATQQVQARVLAENWCVQDA